MGREAESVCLIREGRAELFPRAVSVAVRAHARELQRLVVEGRPVLVHISPNASLSISYHPCVFWELGAVWLDSGTMHEDAAYRRESESCPAGFVDGGNILEANDPRCPSTSSTECPWRRCVRGARLKFVGQGHVTLHYDDGDDAGERIPLESASRGAGRLFPPYGGQCPQFTSIDTGVERVRIAPGVGEKWTLTVDAAGRLVGTITSAGR